MPFLKIVPTNGVHLNNLESFIKAGSFAVGFVAPLFDANDLAAGKFDVVEEKATKLIAAIRAATK